MKKFGEQLQMYFTAIAFTDAGEFNMAVEILKEDTLMQKKHLQKEWEMPRIRAPRR